MRRTLCSTVMLLPLLAAAQLNNAIPESTPEAEGMRPEPYQKAKATLREVVQNGKAAGAVYAVARHGKMVSQDAIGFQDLENRVPMRNDTIFRLFSQSKPLSTAAFLTLIDDGSVFLDDPLYKFFPEFGDVRVFNGEGRPYVVADRPILIRHLLTHTAGFTYGFMDQTPVDQMYARADILRKDEDLTAKMARLAKLPLLSQPGTKWVYGVCTDVLGAVAEKVTGLRFDQFMQERILEPLGMADTGFWVPPEKLGRFARVYENTGPWSRLAYSPDDSYNTRPAFLSGGGGLVSTASDYMHFCLLLANKGEFNGVRVLQTETVTSMMSNHLAPQLLPMRYNPNFAFQNYGFGYGMSVAQSDNAIDREGEVTWGGALSTNFYVSPKDETALVYMVQIKPYAEEVKHAIRPAVYESIVTRNNDIALPPANAYVDPYPSGREHEAVIAPEGTQATQKTGLRGFINY